MIVDAGSTGSRLFIYDVSGSKVVRVGSEKTTPGLSCFVYGCNPDKYPTPTDQYMKLVRYANEIIPVELRGKTEITVKATAGMRLLSEEDQDAIYASLLSGLTSHPDFHYKIGSISTLRGDLEGYYGLVSSNHLLTSDSAGGDTKGYSGNEGYRPVGSLDMGGSSTQVRRSKERKAGAKQQLVLYSDRSPPRFACTPLDRRFASRPAHRR